MSDYDESDYDDDDPKPLPAIRSLLGRNATVQPYKKYDPITGEWRNAVRFARQPVSDEQKGTFLLEYMKWGRMNDAAAAAGISGYRIRKLAEEDEEFADAVTLAEAHYRDKLIQHHQNLVFEGTEKISYDRNGNVVSKERIYPIRLIEMELKKHDSGYRDKQEVEITHKGGVLVAPAEVKSIEDWENRFSQAKNITPGDEDDESVEIIPPR